jgi:hypothetical protein
VLSEMSLSSCLIVTLPALILLSFMFCFLVLSVIALCCCLIVTFLTLVLPFFMYRLLVACETPFTCCLMTTYVTAIFYFLVQIVVMYLKHSLSSSFILTLVTGKHVSFITAYDELEEKFQVNKSLSNTLIIIFDRKEIISVDDCQICDK